MNIRASLAGAAAMLLAAASAQAQTLTISDIQVEADLTAVSNSNAAAYWGTLDADLSAALAAELVDIIAPEGMVLIVDLDEVSLASILEAEAGADDARITGDVGIYDMRTEDVERQFTISASANEAATFLPAGTDAIAVSPSSAEFYAAVVQAFARGISQTLRTGG